METIYKALRFTVTILKISTVFIVKEQLNLYHP